MSETQLTYAGIASDGSIGDPNAVTIEVEPIRDLLFLVTWTEDAGTTVVHLEDFKNDTIITNITSPGRPLVKFHGTMTFVS